MCPDSRAGLQVRKDQLQGWRARGACEESNDMKMQCPSPGLVKRPPLPLISFLIVPAGAAQAGPRLPSHRNVVQVFNSPSRRSTGARFRALQVPRASL